MNHKEHLSERVRNAIKARDTFCQSLVAKNDYFAGYGAGTYKHIMECLNASQDGIILPPIVIELHPSELCTAKCMWCTGTILPTVKPTEKNVLSEKIIESLLINVTNFWDRYGICGEFKMAGRHGDPLHPSRQHLTRFVINNLMAINNIKVGIFTNGFGMTHEILESILKCSYIFISRDGTNPKTISRLKGVEVETVYRTDAIIKSFAKTRQTNSRIVMGYVIVPDNIDEALEAIPFAKDAGYDGIRFKFSLTEHCPTSEYQKKAEEIRSRLVVLANETSQDGFEIWEPLVPFSFTPSLELPPRQFFEHCMAQHNMAIVTCNGEIHGCYLAPSQHPWFSFGNILEKPFDTIWCGYKRQRFIQAFPLTSCRVCPTAPWLMNNLMAVKLKLQS